MKKLIKNNVSWVGKVDWELRKFHGEELSTHRGSSYNSYLIQEKNRVGRYCLASFCRRIR
jgi:flavorubredoxin